MRKLLTLCLSLLLLAGLALPVSAAGVEYVMDDAGLLLPEQQIALNIYAEEITKTYGIGIYILTAEDFRDYGEESGIFDVLWNYYHDNALGFGPDRQGMILMLSMRGRDYATFFYGADTEYAFNTAGQVELENSFLPYFGNNDWYGGFWDYLAVSEDFMARAAAGDPVRENPWPRAGVFVLIALLISLVITRIQWSRMANVSAQVGASRYQTGEGLVLTHRQDRFLNQTVSRRKIPQPSSSGSGGSSRSRSHSGGGGRGRSGKF